MRQGSGLLAFALAVLIAGMASAEQRRSSTLEKIESLWQARWDAAEKEAKTRIEELLAEDETQRQRVTEIDAAIVKLQPWFGQGITAMEISRRGFYKRELIAAISRATRRYEIDHRIAVAMAMRETSLLPYYGYGGKSGSAGERGYFQVYPHGEAERTCSAGCNQFDPACNAITAMCYLASRRDRCGDDPWLYVSAYNQGGCVSPSAARELAYTRGVRARLCAFADCQTIWPE